jgi:glycosyltransferase involved in cell wall biosynthesis
VPRDEPGVLTEKLPLVSILTPSFNQAAFLPDNLRSVECQTYARVEHIVIDGSSTDGSVEILQDAGDSVRWRSEPDEGQADAVNKAFRESQGEMIGWLNSDDAYFDCRVIEDAVAYFLSHPDVDAVYGHCLQITGAAGLSRCCGRRVSIPSCRRQ